MADQSSTQAQSADHPKVQLYILTYNRPEYVLESLNSALSQDYRNLEIVVSDNSTSNAVEDLLKRNFPSPNFKYIRRQPSLPALSHFNLIFNEVETEYFILFHDDDILLPNAVSTYVKTAQKFPKVIALASNGYVIDSSGSKKNRFMTQLKRNALIDSAEELAKHYLDFELGHPPFPSYFYSRTHTRGLTMDFRHGQKYADVSFLIKLAKRGPLLWLAEPLMHYRRHSGNDSLMIDMKATFSLCRFIRRETKVADSFIRNFKVINFFGWSKQRRLGIANSMTPHRDQVIEKSKIYLGLRHPLPLLTHLVGSLRRRVLALFFSAKAKTT